MFRVDGRQTGSYALDGGNFREPVIRPQSANLRRVEATLA